jgi:hypothetical protein
MEIVKNERDFDDITGRMCRSNSDCIKDTPIWPSS